MNGSTKLRRSAGHLQSHSENPFQPTSGWPCKPSRDGSCRNSVVIARDLSRCSIVSENGSPGGTAPYALRWWRHTGLPSSLGAHRCQAGRPRVTQLARLQIRVR